MRLNQFAAIDVDLLPVPRDWDRRDAAGASGRLWALIGLGATCYVVGARARRKTGRRRVAARTNG